MVWQEEYEETRTNQIFYLVLFGEIMMSIREGKYTYFIIYIDRKKVKRK